MDFNVFISKSPLDFLRKYSKRRNKLLGKQVEDIKQFSFKEVKIEFPELMNKGKYEELISLVLKKPIWKVRLISNINKLEFVFWILDEYDKINAIELKYLSTPPDPKLVQAGINDLDFLGVINIIDSISLGNILNWEKISNLPFEKVLTKQIKMTIENKIAKKLNKLND